MPDICKSYRIIIPSLKKNLKLVIFSYTLMSFGDGLVAPLFIRYLESLGATPSMIGCLGGLNYLFMSIGIIYGHLVDLLGRRKIIIVTHFIFAVSLLLFIFTNSWVGAMIGIILLGVKTVSDPAIDAIVADDTCKGERGRIYSMMWIFITLATIISSGILAVIVDVLGLFTGIRLGFAAYCTIAFISAILFYLFLDETCPADLSQPESYIFKHFFQSLKEIITIASVNFINFLAYYIIETPARVILMTYYALYFAHVVKASDAVIASVFSISMVIYLLIQLIIGPLADRFERVRILLALLSITLACNIILIFSYKNLPVSVAACSLMIATIYLEQYLHKILMADVTSKQGRGTSLGLIRTTIGVQSIFWIFIGGILFEVNPTYPLILSACSIIASIVVFNYRKMHVRA